MKSQTVAERIAGKPGTYRDVPLCVALGLCQAPARSKPRSTEPLKG